MVDNEERWIMSPVKNNKNSKRKHKTAEQLTPNRQLHISGGSQKDVSKLDIRRRQLKYRELELHNNILNQINDVVIAHGARPADEIPGKP